MPEIRRTTTETRYDRSLLVVDDDESVREGLVELLTDEGYYVVTAENGVEALLELRRVPRFRPRLILLDMTMPVMNGQEFYDQKQMDPVLAAIPVVVMSADRSLHQRTGAFECEYLAKPQRRQAILNMVWRYVGAGLS